MNGKTLRWLIGAAFAWSLFCGASFGDNFYPDANALDGEPESVRAAIAIANSNSQDDVIWLDLASNGTYTLTIPGPTENNIQFGDLDIESDEGHTLTIRSRGGANSAAINAFAMNARVFDIHKGANVTFQNLQVYGGSTWYGLGGSCMLIRTEATVSVIGCWLARHSSLSGGGAIANVGTFTIRDSTLTTNSASSGGAIVNLGVMTLTNSTVRSNRSRDRGGGIYNGGELTIRDSIFEENDARFGGAIHNFGTLTIQDDCIIRENTAFDGGGISNVYRWWGGDSWCAIEGATIRDNEAESCGGGVYNTGDELTIRDTSISSNIAGNGGGIGNVAYPDADGLVTITDTSMLDNFVDRAGGAVYNRNGVVIIWRSEIRNNRAEFGGALSARRAVSVIADSEIVNNSASANGGAIQNSGSYIEGYVFLMDSSVVRGNQAAGDGGGICNYATLEIESGTELIENTSGDRGGGVYNSDRMRVRDASILKNFAMDGGGIHNSSGEVDVYDSDISDNMAQESGGGIVNAGGGRVTVANTSIENNASQNGGGIFNDRSLDIVDCALLNNVAVLHGGGIYNRGIAVATIANTTVAANVAELGAGIYNYSSYKIPLVIMGNATFSENLAEQGGAVFNQGTIWSLNCTLTNNVASTEAGGCFNDDEHLLYSVNTIIAANTSRRHPDLKGPFSSLGHNLVGDATGGTGFHSSDLLGTATVPLDPILGALADNGGPNKTHMPELHSPLIDRGDNLSALKTDQRGVTRPQDGNGDGSHIVDIGAVEVQSPRARKRR